MMDDRPAPTVTITDPNRTAPAGDVLVSGDEKAPWRAKRWHYELLALVVALGLAVVVPQQVVSARAADHRTALAAADNARVSVSLGVVDNDPATPIEAAVTNDGPDPVTVLSLHLLADGYPTLRVDAPAKAIGIVQVPVPDTRACTESLVNGSPGGMATVRLRVAGRTVTRTVVAQGDLWEALTTAAQDRCGYLPGPKALVASLSTRPIAKGLEVSMTLRNKGRLPLSVRSAFSLTPGIEVPPPISFATLPAGGQAKAFRFRLLITDCGQLQPAVSAVQVQVQVEAQVQLSNGTASGDSVELSDRFPALALAIERATALRCGTA